LSDTRFEPFFLDGPAGRIFAILRAASDARHAVLIIPPFGEEMNKSRRQFTEVAQRLVGNGFAVLVVDLYGTGDSEGEFSEASWEGCVRLARRCRVCTRFPDCNEIGLPTRSR